MTATQHTSAINTLNTVEALLDKLKTAIIVLVAIALVLAFNAYNLGVGFRGWCDDLVASSMATPQTQAIAPVHIAGYLMPHVEHRPSKTPKPRKPRKQAPKAMGKPYENLTSATYNECWALKRVPLDVVAKSGTIEFDDNPYGD
jgi:hypothetical protein